MKNTKCEDCVFAKSVDQEQSCFFGIPNIVKDIHIVEISNNHHIIKNYQCRYGFSKKIHQENIDKFINVDMVDFVKKNNIVRYSLSILIDDKDYTEQEKQKTIEELMSLSIKPYYITIVCGKDGQMWQTLLDKQNIDIKYKVHNFLEATPIAKALHIALETNKKNIGHLMWILSPETLTTCIKNDSIQNINYNINVKQKPAHYYTNNIKSNLDGIFINTDNYWALTKTEDYCLLQDDKLLMEIYD